MKIWNIVDENLQTEIEIGEITILSGQQIKWYNLIRSIEHYFNERQSKAQLFEDGLPINKRDWQCFMIPFDAEVQLNKITTKSPLKEVQKEISEKITYSVFFQELQEIWDQFGVEMDLINKQLEKWGLASSLKPFEEQDITQFIHFHSSSSSFLSPLGIKMLLLNIILNRPFDKKTLIIIELPELFAGQKEWEEFTQLLKTSMLKGYQFLIISDKLKIGMPNYFYKETVINNAVITKIQNKVQQEVPFYCSDELYDETKNILLKLVNNTISHNSLMSQHKNDGAVITIMHVIMYNLGIDSSFDTQGLEPNIKKFIANYHD